jgi:hypothetical protein
MKSPGELPPEGVIYRQRRVCVEAHRTVAQAPQEIDGLSVQGFHHQTYDIMGFL